MRCQLSQKEIDLLQRCKEQGYLEYRDGEFKNIEEFRRRKYVSVDQNFFLSRNEGGTLEQAYELEQLGFLSEDMNAWHITFKLTEKGEELFDDNFFLKTFTYNDLQKAHQAGKENIDFLTFINNNYDIQ